MRGLVKLVTICGRSGLVAFSAIWLTMAEPTMTPSETLATMAAWSGVLMPKPTQTGTSVCFLMAATVWPMVSEGAAWAPVTPVRESA